MTLKEFVCFYCGNLKPGVESSDEHIVPSCIGGNRNVTLTDQVCDQCNSFMGDNVDRPFCRDWFIEASRLLAGVGHRGKRPTSFMGELDWGRPERVSVFLLEGGANIFVIEGTDGQRRLAIGLDENKSEMVELVQKTIKKKFPGLPVVNDASTHTQYDLELANAVIATGGRLPLKFEVSLVAWHREIVKMALGLACLQLGTPYIGSPGATILRKFLHENDPNLRDNIQLHGHAGLSPHLTPSLTKFWHPGGDEHLFALISTGDKIAFVANLFGKYENLVEVDMTGAFHALLPGTSLKGVCWLVDPEAKATRGPLALEELMRQALPTA